MEKFGTLWVCMCCMLAHANGECCTERALKHGDGTYCFEGRNWCDYAYADHEVDYDAPLLHGGDGIEPWSDVDFTEYDVAMGLTSDEHSEGCEVRLTGEWPNNFECDCEHDDFSTSQCEGCGSSLHGERWAFTLFTRADSPTCPFCEADGSHE